MFWQLLLIQGIPHGEVTIPTLGGNHPRVSIMQHQTRGKESGPNPPGPEHPLFSTNFSNPDWSLLDNIQPPDIYIPTLYSFAVLIQFRAPGGEPAMVHISNPHPLHRGSIY